MARFPLVDITITPGPSVRSLKRLFPELEEEVLDYLKVLSRDLQDASKAAFQTTVPIRTGELRDVLISERAYGNLKFSVFVLDKTHRNTPGRRKPTGAELAEWLDIGSDGINTDLKRRKNAVPAFHKLISITAPLKGAPTAGWVDGALTAIHKAIDKIG